MLRTAYSTPRRLARKSVRVSDSLSLSIDSISNRQVSRIRPSNHHIFGRSSNSSSSYYFSSSRLLPSTTSTPPSHFDPSAAYDSSGKIPTAPYDLSPLPGTVPFYKSHLIVSPTKPNSRPESTWPSHLESVSPLISELSSRTKNGASLQGFAIAFSQGFERVNGAKSHDNDPDAKEFKLKPWDHQTSKFMRPVPNDSSEEETFRIDVFKSDGKHSIIPEISLKTLDQGRPFAEKVSELFSEAPTAGRKTSGQEVFIYVCVHGSRDCRCGVVGPQLIDALKEEISKYQESMTSKGDTFKKVNLAGVSHVGGHKWAANALVYPHGDWYGNLRPSDAPLLLRAALAPSTSIHDLQDLRERLVHWTRWRGRLGMEELDQRQHYDLWGPPLISQANLVPKQRPTSTSSPKEPSRYSQSEETPQTIEEEVPLRFRSFEGKEYNLYGKIGESLKDVAKKNDLPSIEATCGGQLECATCHAWLRDEENHLPSEKVLEGKSEEENDMLDYAIDRKESSRLICQVKVSKELSDWMMQEGGRCQLPRF